VMLRDIVPRDVDSVLLFDRGFRRISLVRHLKRLGFHFAIKSCSDAHVITAAGAKIALKNLCLSGGIIKDYGQFMATTDKPEDVRLVAVFDSAEEALAAFSVLDLPPYDMVALYAGRFTIEKCFHDSKTHSIFQLSYAVRCDVYDQFCSTPASFPTVELYKKISLEYFMVDLHTHKQQNVTRQSTGEQAVPSVVHKSLSRIRSSTHKNFAGTLLVLIGLTAPSTLLSDTWRDSIREEAQKYDHSDYPEYERPDKQQFLDSYYRSEGIYNTNALVVRFKNGFDPEAVTRDLVYQENPDNLDKRTSELSNFKGILAEYAVVSFIEPISSVPSEILEKDRLEAEFFTNRQFPDLRLYYRIIFEDN